MKAVFILLFGLALANNVLARLGETKSQLIARFGKPTAEFEQKHSQYGFTYPVGNVVTFQKDDWKIECLIISNWCEQITYWKPGEWTDEQFKALLSSNSGTNKWEEILPRKPNNNFRTWSRSDGAIAQYPYENRMKFTTPAYSAEIKRIEEAALQRSRKVPKF